MRPGARVLILVFVLCGVPLIADNFADAFQQALTLYRNGRYAEAEQAFLALAHRSNVRQRGRDEAYGRAVYCAVRQKMFDKAFDLASNIKREPVRKYYRMEILKNQRKYDQILGLLREEDLSQWPDRLIHRAALCRGRIHARKNNARVAEDDFLLAKKLTMYPRELARVNVALARLYRDAFKEPKKALTFFAESAELPYHLDITTRGIPEYARLLVAQGNKNEAISLLNGNRQAIDDPRDEFRFFRCYGDVYAAAGKAQKASSYYQKALKVPNAPRRRVRDLKEQIRERREKTESQSAEP